MRPLSQCCCSDCTAARIQKQKETIREMVRLMDSSDPLPGTADERAMALDRALKGTERKEDSMAKAEHKSNGKPPLALLPRAGLEGVAKVMAFGAQKYDMHNWRKGSDDIEFLNSTLRHIYKYLDGEDLDDESGEHHLSHAACDILFILQWIKDGILDDKRYKRTLNSATPREAIV